MTIKIKYFDKSVEPINIIPNGDWIDLRARETVHLKQGEYKQIPLNVAIELPKGFEALVLPRSSTFKKYGVICVNSMGVIDNSYNGDDDEWQFPVFATRDTVIEKGERICQFRIMANQPQLPIIEVEILNNKNRNGFGSTGVK